jgi:hypothetical protein
MGKEDDELLKKLEPLLARASSREGARNILSLLFPKADRALANDINEIADRSESKAQRRIADRDFTSAYFRLDPQPATWGRTELALVLDRDPQTALSLAKEKINLAPERDRPRLRRLFLEALDGAFGQARPFTLNWLIALINESPYFLRPKVEETVDIFARDNFQRLHRVLIGGLRDLEANQRFEMFVVAVPQAEDISLLCDFVRLQLSDLNPKGAKRERDSLYFGSRGEELRGLLLQRVRSMANEGALWSQANPGRILWFWWGSDLETEVRSFTDAAQDTPEGLRALLEITISRVQSSAGDYDHVSHRQWSMIVDLRMLEKRARVLIESKASEADVERAQRFLIALKKGEEDHFS